jgi:hypothetical protein
MSRRARPPSGSMKKQRAADCSGDTATTIRSVEQLPESERRRLISASLQVRPSTKQRREFARLRRRLQQMRRAESDCKQEESFR